MDVDDEKEIQEYKADQLRFKRKHHKNHKEKVNAEEMKELEKLEDNTSKLDDN